MLLLGKFWAAAVVLALSNLDLLKIRFAFGWTTYGLLLGGLLFCFAMVNIFPNWNRQNFSRLGMMLGGETLMEICALSVAGNIIAGIYGLGRMLPRLAFQPSAWNIALHLLFWLLLTGILAWNGFLRIYLSSVQLGIKWRVLFLLLWWAPVLNLILLGKMCAIVREEYRFETEKEAQNQIRRLNESCKTRYPIVLVHGVFFRDRKCFNYWGRIPGELIRNGAVLFYGGQQSAAATKDAAEELTEHITKIVTETGCQKVNIIAHSKGGLESRYAISHLGLSSCVASLTTINTPHRGCAFVDWLLEKMPPCLCRWLAKRYNSTLKRLGDSNPDFYAAVRDLTTRRCERFNCETPDAPEVFYQSVGSRMNGWRSAPFPQNWSYLLVRHFEKENDGLVGVDSMKWGSRFQLLPVAGKRGIAHGDMIDLHRQNIPGFDVREFYVSLVRQLKEQGF